MGRLHQRPAAIQPRGKAAVGVKLYKAHLIYDASGNIYEASNPVTLTLVK